MQSEIELVKCILLTCKMLSEICGKRKEHLEVQAENKFQHFGCRRARVWQTLRAALSVAAVVFLKAFCIISYALSLVEHMRLVP